ncbi:ribonuclease HII [Arthrobacter roseus]|nr:ribonuclease HII [Arthrobacter roseus]
MVMGAPTLRFERTFSLHGHRYVAGCDEVGRGALAGPVSVGIVVIDLSVVRSLKGVRDSKLLSPSNREILAPKIARWAVASAVGHASAAEIDDVGLIAALRRAGTRAWRTAAETVRPDAVLLDGNHDWLSPAYQSSLFEEELVKSEPGCDSPVFTRIKADMHCTSVAAASVLAKVERDAMMEDLAGPYPHFQWDANKGYATQSHRTAIAAHGASEYHRKTWRLVAETTAERSTVNISGQRG